MNEWVPPGSGTSYCVDSLCREKGPRHLHEPYGDRDAASVDKALRAELARAEARIAELEGLLREARDAIDHRQHNSTDAWCCRLERRIDATLNAAREGTE